MAIGQGERRTRRSVIAAGLGGMAAALLGLLGRPEAARAEGEVIHVGDEHVTAQSVTRLKNTVNGAWVFRAETTKGGTALAGSSVGGDGVIGESGASGKSGVYGAQRDANGFAVFAQNFAHGTDVALGGPTGRGVHAESPVSDGVGGVATASNRSGVYGVTHNAAGYGVFGRNTGTGATASLAGKGGSGVDGDSPNGDGLVGRGHAAGRSGVFGISDNASGVGVFGRNAPAGNNGWAGTGHAGLHGSSTSGAGVLAESGSGIALVAKGRVQLQQVSGVATIPAGQKSVSLHNPHVRAGSFVLLTPRGNLGGRSLWYTTDPATSKLSIQVSSAPPGPLAVAWLLLG